MLLESYYIACTCFIKRKKIIKGKKSCFCVFFGVQLLYNNFQFGRYDWKIILLPVILYMLSVLNLVLSLWHLHVYLGSHYPLLFSLYSSHFLSKDTGARNEERGASQKKIPFFSIHFRYMSNGQRKKNSRLLCICSTNS